VFQPVVLHLLNHPQGLQCVAMCCNVLQRVAVGRASLAQSHVGVAVCCNVLQRVAVGRDAAGCSVLHWVVIDVVHLLNHPQVLQCGAVGCVRCSVMQ